MKFRKLLCGGTVLAGLTVLGLVGMARPALATDGPTATVPVDVTVTASCSMSLTTSPALGDYSATASSDDTDDTGVLSYQCSPGSSATITLSEGDANSFSPRYMTDGASDDLPYNVYTSNGGSTIWGDGTNGSSAMTTTDDGLSHMQNIFIDIPSGAWVPTGAYTDSLTATIVY